MPAYLSEGSRRYNQLRKVQPHDIVGKLGYYLPPDSSHLQSPTSTSDQSIYSVRREQTSACASGRAPDDERLDTRKIPVARSGGKTSNANRVRCRPNKDLSSISSTSAESTRQAASTAEDASSSSSSYIAPTLGNYLQFQRKFRQHARTIGRRLGLDIETTSPQNVTSHKPSSPANSSGFSEDTGTIAGASIVEIYPKHHSQLQLNDASRRLDSSAGSQSSPRRVGHKPQHVTYANEVKQEAQLDATRRNVGVGPAMGRPVVRANGRRNKIGRLRRPSRANRFRSGADNEYHLDYINPYALSELFSQSEIPGFREIFASDSYLRKFCWIIAFLFMTILSLNDMTELITEYYEYPITVDVRLRDSARLPFPAVTVCNLNVVRFSSLCSSSNAHFDLTNQIPSELRDKLCGIQVEKKNTSDSDIGDINNIGIISTTPAPSTTSASSGGHSVAFGNSTGPLDPSATTRSPGSDKGATTVGSISQLGGAKTTPAPDADETAPGHKGRLRNVPGQTHHRSNQSPFAAAGTTQAPTEAPTTSAQVTATQEPQSTLLTSPSTPGQVTESASSVAATKRTTAKGSLDLDDFIEPSMLQHWDARQGRGAHRKRSIGNGEANLRPFASNESQLQLTHELASDRSPHASGQQHGGRRLQQHRSHRQRQPSFLFTTNGTHPGRLTAHRNYPASQQHDRRQPPSLTLSSSGGNPTKVHPAGGFIGGSISANGGGGGVGNINNNANAHNENHNPVAKLGASGAIANQVAPPQVPQSPQSRPSQLNITSFALPPALTDDFEITERQERELQENLTNWLAVMYNREPLVTRTLGHQFDDMILRCTMKSINCTRQKSFESSFSPTEGNCFTYRSRIKRRQQIKQGASRMESVFEEANLAGTNDGLELVLNLEKNEYIAGSSQVGALVMIHHPNDLGYAASEATFIAPEFTTYIGLKMVNITRLPAPYPESCVDSWPAKFADALVRNSTYSQQTCLKICLQKTIQTHCQCQSAFLPIVELDGGNSAASAQTSVSPASAQQQQQPAPPTTTTSGPSTTAPTSTTTAASLSPISTISMPTTVATAAASPAPMAPAPATTATSATSTSATGPTSPDSSSMPLAVGQTITPPISTTARSVADASASTGTTTNPKHATTTTPAPPQQRIIICDTRRSATRQCVKEVMFRAADRVHNCECPPKCQVIRYDKTISMARWPTREDKVTFDRGKADVNFQNLAKVIVYFQTMTCEEVTQQAVFNAAKLFSALGGIMGMYVGFSFLSVFEIFEVMSRKVWHYATLKFTSQQSSPLPKRIVFPTSPQDSVSNVSDQISNAEDGGADGAQYAIRTPSLNPESIALEQASR